ncbi:MAG: hypothetical protein Ct9H300mP4_14840 [Gammaproteobacteria bacterium]|nr:MAG: hypothetical protein Ct9H300mP4_14840 [Gammaproteobacteria bacterium]
MSSKARDGVVNKWGQTHDIKNLFISDGRFLQLEQLKILLLLLLVLGLRQADRIASEMSKKNI